MVGIKLKLKTSNLLVNDDDYFLITNEKIVKIKSKKLLVFVSTYFSRKIHKLKKS